MLQVAIARDGGGAGGAAWASRRTERRANMRRTKAAQGRADRIQARRHGGASPGSGSESDESAASARRRMGLVRFAGEPSTSASAQETPSLRPCLVGGRMSGR